MSARPLWLYSQNRKSVRFIFNQRGPTYTAVDFGQGRTWFHGSVGEDPNYAGRQFQIRLDSLTGPVLGTITVMNTGGFDTYTDQSVPIAPTAGKHDVYLVALGSSPGVANLDFFTFS
ncbi:carbohydrate-binding protein [Kutzneria sp. 744]|uniref:carbohydrate-binding protein n=1 Tax=Kutzneria sp. (strain 744) TaxID=345341 RepID=UPI0003EEC589|nr:carbohydrate-binding protein [Kutzneria sp. 744]EWM11642.1 secreted sugar hydrolase [Kutzneria sp. 744]